MDLEQKVINIVQQQLNIAPEKIKAKSSFLNDLNADSLDIVELIMAMEEEFELDIPDAEAEALKTVEDVVKYLKSKGVS